MMAVRTGIDLPSPVSIRRVSRNVNHPNHGLRRRIDMPQRTLVDMIKAPAGNRNALRVITMIGITALTFRQPSPCNGAKQGADCRALIATHLCANHPAGSTANDGTGNGIGTRLAGRRKHQRRSNQPQTQRFTHGFAPQDQDSMSQA